MAVAVLSALHPQNLRRVQEVGQHGAVVLVPKGLFRVLNHLQNRQVPTDAGLEVIHQFLVGRLSQGFLREDQRGGRVFLALLDGYLCQAVHVGLRGGDVLGEALVAEPVVLHPAANGVDQLLSLGPERRDADDNPDDGEEEGNGVLERGLAHV